MPSATKRQIRALERRGITDPHSLSKEDASALRKTLDQRAEKIVHYLLSLHYELAGHQPDRNTETFWDLLYAVASDDDLASRVLGIEDSLRQQTDQAFQRHTGGDPDDDDNWWDFRPLLPREQTYQQVKQLVCEYYPDLVPLWKRMLGRR